MRLWFWLQKIPALTLNHVIFNITKKKWKKKFNQERKQYTHGNELTRPQKHVPFMHCGFYFSLFEDNPRRLDSTRCDSKSLSQSVPKIEALIQSTRTFHIVHKMEQLEMVELAKYLDNNIQCISTHICMRAHSSISLGIILEWRHFIYFVNVTIRSLFIMKSF